MAHRIKVHYEHHSEFSHEDIVDEKVFETFEEANAYVFDRMFAHHHEWFAESTLELWWYDDSDEIEPFYRYFKREIPYRG